MKPRLNNEIEAWEGEGGAIPAPSDVGATPSNGTLSRAEWTQRMKHEVTAKYDRPGSVIPIDCKTQRGKKHTECASDSNQGSRHEAIKGQEGDI